MKRMLLGVGLVGLSLAASEAQAQYPGGSVVYETVAPGTRSVTYGERYVVKQKLFKTVIRERPVRYVTTTPPVVRETRVIRQAPIVEQQVIQTTPVVETRLIQPAPMVQRRLIQSEPVIQTRYLSTYPY
jgi:transglutaminase-like putative cysteine protease